MTAGEAVRGTVALVCLFGAGIKTGDALAPPNASRTKDRIVFGILLGVGLLSEFWSVLS